MPERTRILCVLCFVLVVASGTFYSASATGSDDESAMKSVALSFMENVADIKLEAYNVTYDCKGPINSFLYPGHTEALVNLVLARAKDQFEVEVQFIDNGVASYRLSSENGAPLLNTNEPLNVFDMAKGILRRYQLVSNETPCLRLMAMIDQIVATDKGETVETDLAALSFEPNASLGCSATLIWNCKNAQRKSVGVGINKQGFLDWFSDTWRVYKMSDVKVNVPEEAATGIAFERAREYISRLGATVERVNVTFGYINSYPDARGNDCFVLYPTWTVEYTFDKVYGNGLDGQCLTGYFVGIWADTGEVRTAMPQGFWGSLPSTSKETGFTPAQLGLIVVPAIVVLGALLITVRSRKKNRVKRKHE